MASIYLQLRDYKNKRGESAIRLVIIVNRKASHTNTGYSVEPKYWDESTLQIKPSHPNANSWNKALTAKLQEARNTYGDMDSAGHNIKATKLAKAVAVGSKYIDIALHYSAKFRAAGSIGTADAYKSKAEQINLLFPGIKAMEMDSDWAEEFRAIAEKKYKHNTIVGFFKHINSVLSKAEKDGIISRNLLANAKKGSYRPAIKATVTPEDIETLWKAKPVRPQEAIAKDTFLFSYYCSGARFKDVLLMPKSALYLEGRQMRITWQPYKTKKETGGVIDMPVNKRLAAIIKRNANPSATIFGLIDPKLPPEELDGEISRVQGSIRDNLKMFFVRCGIKKDLSFHDARRSISKNLKVMGADLHGIKDILGHESIRTTQGYVGRDQKGADNLLKQLYK